MTANFNAPANTYHQRLFLIRHGAVETSTTSALYGHTDVEMSELGRRQAKWVSDQLSGASLSAIYSSDLKRALNTAMPIAKDHDLEVTILKDLREINMGRWEGRTFTELMAEDPKLVNSLFEDPIAFSYPGGESFVVFEDRVLTALSRLRTSHKNEAFAMVTHGGACRMILGHVLGLEPRNWLRIAQDCGCINVIDWHDNFPSVLKINQTATLFNSFN